MENASKALIIAGAVLVALLVIAVGTRVFYSTTGATDQVSSSMSTTEISTFNNQFLAFVGANKSMGQVIALLNAIIVNNSKDLNHTVDLAGDYGNDAKSAISDVDDPVKGHKVSISGYDADGYIKTITITKVN